jgi:hypothetical protein
MAEVDRLSKKYNVRADDMLALMASESGINPQAGAPGRAVGLIQFMPNIAKSLGTSDVELLGMNRAQQMKYVEKFYDSVGLPSGATAGMMYAYTFLPGRAKNPSGVLTVAGESYYNSNRGLDLDGDGRITVADLDARIAKKAAEYGLGTGAPTAVAQAPAGTTPAAAAAGVPGVPEQAMQPSPGTPNAPAQGAPTGGAPSGDIVAVGRWLEGQGIRVSEHPAFGGVQPVHRGRGHYEGRALDVNAGAGIVEANDPVWGPKFDQIAAQAKAAGYNVIWRSAGHYNHMHIEIPAGGPTQVAQGGTMPQASVPAPAPPHMQPQRGVGFNMAPQLAARSAEVNIFDAIAQQVNVAMGGPIIINNTRTINNTRRMIAGNSNVGPRASEGFDPLQTFGALAAGFAIGKGLRLF